MQFGEGNFQTSEYTGELKVLKNRLWAFRRLFLLHGIKWSRLVACLILHTESQIKRKLFPLFI